MRDAPFKFAFGLRGGKDGLAARYIMGGMEHIRSEVMGLASQLLQGLDGPERVCSAWPLAAGAAIARHTRAASFAAGNLTVAVSDKAWQEQLDLLRPQLRAHLLRLTGVPVADILFFVESKRP
ncbi:MAG: DciA family protein [Acidobacteriaceae bacterium]